MFDSPTGDGVKVVIRVPADAESHHASYLAVQAHVGKLTGVPIDESCKDVARLCFLSHDPDAYSNPNAVELPAITDAATSVRPAVAVAPEIETRRRISIELLGSIEWHNDTSGYCVCPGRHLHTSGDAARDCEVLIDGAPTIRCFHNSCRGLVDGANHSLRSQIGKAEHTSADTPGRVSAATRLVQFASEFTFLHDTKNRPFVRLPVGDHLKYGQLIRVNSEIYWHSSITSARTLRLIETPWVTQFLLWLGGLVTKAKKNQSFCASLRMARIS